jgi:hypothetical protein
MARKRYMLACAALITAAAITGCGSSPPPAQPAPPATTAPPTGDPATQDFTPSAAPTSNAAYAKGFRWGEKAEKEGVIVPAAVSQECTNATEATISGAIPPLQSWVAGCIAGYKAAGGS